MKPEEKSDLAAAAPKLKILDVILARSSFSRPMQDAPENAKAWQQHKRGVQYATEGSVADGDQELHVLVQLGTRVLMSQEDQGNEGAVQFEIEADFLVRYAMSEVIEESALDTFANLNSVHNAWPFWRQHVFDIVQRGRLPQLEVPLFAGITS